MNKSKPFLFGLGIGLIVAGITVQTANWITQAGQLQLPQPNATLSPLPGEDLTQPSNPNAEQNPVLSVQELEAKIITLQERNEVLRAKLDVKPTIKVFVMDGTGSFTLSSILKRSGVIEEQGPFMDLYGKLGFMVKEGIYSFREKMSAEEALYALGAPVATSTPIPTVIPTVSPASP